MAEDFRVAVDLADHPKTVKMVTRLGEGSFRCLQRLWGFTAKYRQKGLLTGMNVEDIEIAAKWSGEAGQFVAVLIDVRFLDKLKNGLYRIHDWKESNGWVYFAPERREKAKNAAKARHTKSHNKLGGCSDQQLDMPGIGPSCAPIPSPTPSPTPVISEPPASPSVSRAAKKIEQVVQTKSEMREVTDHWMASYAKAAQDRSWTLEKYNFTGKDGKLLSDLIKRFGSKSVREVIDVFFLQEDEFLRTKGGFTVGTFASYFNRLAQQRTLNKLDDPQTKRFNELYALYMAEPGSSPFDREKFLEFCRARDADPGLIDFIRKELEQLETAGVSR